MNVGWLLAVLLVLAAVLRSELFFYLLYVCGGLVVLSRWWLRGSVRGLHWRRSFPPRAAIGEQVTVEIEVTNQGLLPLPWLAVSERVAPALRPRQAVRAVVALGAKGRHTLRYEVAAARRGYYRLGPLQLRTGDVLGLGERLIEETGQQALTVVPTVLPLGALGLPAALPFGVLGSSEPLFSDPSRQAGVRAYQPSDGVRRIDWKSSARVGSPQVRRYDPSIASATLLAVAFSREEYAGRYAYDEMERAVTAAAAVAGYLALRRQQVGLCSSGIDAATGEPLASLPVGRYLPELLGALGRLEPAAEGRVGSALLAASATLGWGSSVALVTAEGPGALLELLVGLRRRGLQLALLQIEATPGDLALARRHGVAAYRVDRKGRPVSDA